MPASKGVKFKNTLSLTTILLAILILIGSIYWLNLNIQSINSAFQEKIRYTNNLIESTARDHLSPTDTAILEKKLSDIEEANKDIYSIKISTPSNGRLIFLKPGLSAVENMPAHTINIKDSDQKLWPLEVTHNKKYLNTEILTHKIFSFSLILAFLTLALLIFLYWAEENKLIKFRELRYRSIFNNLQLPIIELLLDEENIKELSGESPDDKSAFKKLFKISRYNNACSTLLSLTGGSEIEQISNIFSNDAIAKIIESAKKAKHIKIHKSHLALDENSSFKEVHLNIYTYKDTKKGLTFISISMHDLTELNQQIKTQQKLTQQMHMMQRIDSIGTLAGGIAHDFNNILLAINGYIELIKIDPENSENHIVGVEKAINKAKGLISQMLNDPSSSNKNSPVLLQKAINEALNIVRSGIPKDILIKMQIDPTPLYIESSSEQILQIIMNLTTNAYHALSSNKKGSITISLKETPLTPEQEKIYNIPRHQRYANITVSDTGKGINKEDIKYIFDPFFTTKEVHKGTGLGLYVVYSIIQNMGGFITVDSQTTEGSQFNVFLPLMENQVPPIKPSTGHANDKPAKQQTILFVDDDTAVTNVYAKLLNEAGHQIKSFTQPLKALKEIQAQPNKYDIIITDVSMPDISGIELSQIIRGSNINTPIILITGYSANIANADFKQLNIKYLLKKPFTLTELLTAINTCSHQESSPITSSI